MKKFIIIIGIGLKENQYRNPPVNRILLFLSLLLSSCTKVIDLDLNSADPQVVVEGNIADGEFASVKLSKSINLDEPNNFPPIENAIIIVSDNVGNGDTLNEVSPGYYKGDFVTGEVGKTYFLNINNSGEILSSQSTIQHKVNFDSLGVEIVNSIVGGPGNPGGGTNSTFYSVTVYYSDPSEETNYYHFVEYKNSTRINSYTFDDRLTNGNSIETSLVNYSRNLSTGDTLTVEMQCIDRDVYNYYHSFTNLAGGPQNSSTPANPTTNITGTKLGYFNAHTKQRKSIIIQ